MTLLALPSAASATRVGLGTAGSFSVLGGSSVVNTGPTIMPGNLGVDPSAAVTGFPPGTVGGSIHAADAVATQAQSDLVIGYDDATARPSTATVSGDLGGRTLSPGVYTAASSLGLTGDLTLDAGGDPDAVFVFQAGSTLTTASGSRVLLTGGAQACNVFWRVGSSATLGTASSFSGSILALTSISLTTDARIDGRVLARNGAVTLDSNVITSSTCTTGSPAGGTGTPSGGTGTPTTGGGGTGTPTGGTGTPTTGGTGGSAPVAGTPVGAAAAPTAGPAAVAAPGSPTGDAAGAVPAATIPGGGGPTSAPLARTLAPVVVGSTKVRVEAWMRPGGSAIRYRWEYGTTRKYGRRTSTTTGPRGSSGRRVRRTFRGLRPCTVYHHRIAVQAPGGRWTFGRNRAFRTGGCSYARLPRTSGGFAG